MVYATLEDAWGAPWEPAPVVDTLGTYKDPKEHTRDPLAGKKLSKQDLKIALADVFRDEGKAGVQALMPFDIPDPWEYIVTWLIMFVALVVLV